MFSCYESFSLTNYTFCNNSIAITLLDGGKAVMVRFDNYNKPINKVSGEFELIGKGNPTEVLSINFQGNLYRYDLIRNENGKPNLIIDSQGRKYNICRSLENESNLENNISNISSENFNSRNPKSSIEDFIVVDNIAITKYDVNYGVASWDDAKDACEKLGNGWHLPNYDELELLYKNKNGLKFTEGGYWSSSKTRIKEGEGSFLRYYDGAFTLDLTTGKGEATKFVIGELGGRTLISLKPIRAVKTLTEDQVNYFKKRGSIEIPKLYQDSLNLVRSKIQTGLDSLNKIKRITDSIEIWNPIKIIGTPKKIGKLEIAENDLPRSVSLKNAKKILNGFPKGRWEDRRGPWRIPKKEELDILYQNKTTIGGFYSVWYWSSTTSYDMTPPIKEFYWIQILNDVMQGKKELHEITNDKWEEYRVRPVRTTYD